MKNINLTEINNLIQKTDYIAAINSIIYIEKYLNSKYKYTNQIKYLIQKSQNSSNNNTYYTMYKSSYNFGYTQNNNYNELDFKSIFNDLSNQLKNSASYSDGIDYINQIINKKGLSNAQISDASSIEPSYLSKILNKKRVMYNNKDLFVKLCIGMGLNYDESRKVLLKLGLTIDSELKRDKILKYSLQKNYSVTDIDYILSECKEEPWL